MRPVLTGRGSSRPSMSGDGWRTRLPAALPLFVIAAVSFGVSFLLFHAVAEGPGRLPFWTLFSATGGILAIGGTVVAVAGGDEPGETSPLYDAERFVLLPKEEYERLRSTGASPAFAPTPSASLTQAPPSVPVGAMGGAAATSAEWSEEPAAPPGHIRTTSDLESALNEVESVLASLATPTESTPAGRTAEASPLRRPLSPTDRAVAPESASARPTPARGGTTERPGSATSAASRGICTSCGIRIPNATKAVRCHACDEPLCVACAARADWQGHADLCPRCHGLLVLSRDAEDGS